MVRLLLTGLIALLLVMSAAAQAPQQQMMMGSPTATGACSVGTDISNGWCLIAHTIAGSANTTSVTTTGVNTTGADLIVLVIGSYGGIVDITSADVSDSKSNSWTSAIHQAGAQANTLIVYTKPTSVGASHTFTVSNALASFPVLAVIAVSGSHATPVDQTNKTIDSAAATSMQSGSITPSQNNTLVISGWVLLAQNTGTPTVNSSMTIEFLNGDGVNRQTGGSAYITQSTAAAINPTWSWVVSGTASASIISFKHS